MRNYIVLLLGCLLFHLAGTWSLPLIDRDEPRFAEAAREMRERADFVVPYFNNEFRFDKPPLTHTTACRPTVPVSRISAPLRSGWREARAN